MKCPHCGADLVVNALVGGVGIKDGDVCYFGEGHRVRDITGREVLWRMGNCSKCWRMVDLVNGEVAIVGVIPMGREVPG